MPHSIRALRSGFPPATNKSPWLLQAVECQERPSGRKVIVNSTAVFEAGPQVQKETANIHGI